MTNATLKGKPDAGNPHVRFDEGEVASGEPRRGSLLYKKIVFLAFVASVNVSLASAYFANVTNEWRQGRQTNVLAMAERRLSSNTNDIAGLLMKASYDFDFANATVLSNSLARVLSVGDSVSTPAFTNWFWRTKIDIRSTFRTLAIETDDQHAADVLKVQGPGRPMAYEEDLKALDDDGYFAE